jgi:uncharacterized membrane protein YhaH (DUF805 family)
MKSLRTTFASHEGRLSQQGYVLAFVLPFGAVAGLGWLSLTGALGEMSSLALQSCALGLTFVMAFGDALNVRRYHDLGNSGRLYRLCRPGIVVLPLLAFALHFLIPAQMASAGDLAALSYLINQEFAPSIGPVPLALLGLTFFGVVANLAYLSLMPGQAGPNEFGPDPRGGSAIPGSRPPVSGPNEKDDDPVQRALAEYQKQRATPPQAARVAAPVGRTAAAGAFGKKRS